MIISSKQFGFRKGKSTTHAVSRLTESIVRGLDEKDKCLAIFLDLRKAFDTISIPLLLDKLEKVGVRGSQLDLFRDYLSGRQQSVRVGNFTSEPRSMDFGVPQGSILGPTLFLLYINNLCNIKIPFGQITTFADDTVLLFKGASWEVVFNRAQAGFDTVCKWLADNLLSLNAEKTKYMTFTIVSSTQPNPDSFGIKVHSETCYDSLPTKCPCDKLQKVESIKYLGVILDQCLTFQEHIKSVTVRVRKLLSVFKNIRHVAGPHTMKTIYLALCHSIVTYCIGVWGGTAKTHMLPLERGQRAALKVCLFLPIRTPTTIVYNSSCILSIRKSFILNCVLDAHSITLQHGKTNFRYKRRKDIVFDLDTCRTEFARGFKPAIGKFLYNKLSQLNTLYTLKKFELKKWTTTFLMSLTYAETENLLITIA